MLVLSRKRDEVICIGDDITITVVDIRGDKVRLGIKAPRDVPVHRKEVAEAIKKQERQEVEYRRQLQQDLNQAVEWSRKGGGSGF